MSFQKRTDKGRWDTNFIALELMKWAEATKAESGLGVQTGG